MAVGKNKRLTKGKKGTKKKTGDPFAKKEWYDIYAPIPLSGSKVGTTLVNKTAAQKTSSEQLLGRVAELCIADVCNNAEDSYRNVRLLINDVQGKICTTSFCGMNFTSDKLRSLVKKSHTLIEAFTDIRTTDGYLLRIFLIGFTFRQKSQVRKTTYAQTARIKLIRRKMIEVVQDFSHNSSLNDFILHMLSEVTGKAVEKACSSILPLVNVHIRKVKVLKAPKYEAPADGPKIAPVAEEDTGVDEGQW